MKPKPKPKQGIRYRGKAQVAAREVHAIKDVRARAKHQLQQQQSKRQGPRNSRADRDKAIKDQEPKAANHPGINQTVCKGPTGKPRRRRGTYSPASPNKSAQSQPQGTKQQGSQEQGVKARKKATQVPGTGWTDPKTGRPNISIRNRQASWVQACHGRNL